MPKTGKILENEDGQLPTLGLLEQLRAETAVAGAAFSNLNSRVDKLLRDRKPEPP
jgi:hypothetical protein